MKIQTLFGSLEELEQKEQLRKEGKLGFVDRMKDAVTKTRDNLSDRIEEIVSFNKEIDANTLDDLEASLIGADLGSTTTHEILSTLRERANHKQIDDVVELKRLLKEQISEILARDRKSTRLNSSHLVISYAVFCLKKKKVTAY